MKQRADCTQSVHCTAEVPPVMDQGICSTSATEAMVPKSIKYPHKCTIKSRTTSFEVQFAMRQNVFDLLLHPRRLQMY